VERFKQYESRLDRLELKEVGVLVFMIAVCMPAFIAAAVINPVLGVFAAILLFAILGYELSLIYRHHKIAVDYDKGYPQSLVHPNRIYKEIQIRKKNENMEYDCAALGLLETIRYIRKRTNRTH
jgi:hypothetical protein